MREDEIIPVEAGGEAGMEGGEEEGVNAEEAKLMFYVFFLCFLVFFFFIEGMIHKYQPMIGH